MPPSSLRLLRPQLSSRQSPQPFFSGFLSSLPSSSLTPSSLSSTCACSARRHFSSAAGLSQRISKQSPHPPKRGRGLFLLLRRSQRVFRLQTHVGSLRRWEAPAASGGWVSVASGCVWRQRRRRPLFPGASIITSGGDGRRTSTPLLPPPSFLFLSLSRLLLRPGGIVLGGEPSQLFPPPAPEPAPPPAGAGWLDHILYILDILVGCQMPS